MSIGDIVYVHDALRGTYSKHKVMGFQDGVPFVDKYGDEERGYAWNGNNYIRANTVRLVEKGEEVPAF